LHFGQRIYREDIFEGLRLGGMAGGEHWMSRCGGKSQEVSHQRGPSQQHVSVTWALPSLNYFRVHQVSQLPPGHRIQRGVEVYRISQSILECLKYTGVSPVYHILSYTSLFTYVLEIPEGMASSDFLMANQIA
jgi:hypothetical protein